MRHQKRGRALSRTHSHRKAMLGNLATEVLRHHRVTTGHFKALEVRRVVERLITYGKRGDLPARRKAATIIHDAGVLQKLFADIAPKFMERNGGYTRVLKIGVRPGDAAKMAIIELVGLAQSRQAVETPAAEAQKAPAADKPAKVKAVKEKPAKEKPAAEKPAKKAKKAEPGKDDKKS